jgi:hypothetical protein
MKTKLLRSYGFSTGSPGMKTTCTDCNKSIGGRLGWWHQTSYEYGDYEAKCRMCAESYCEQYESFVSAPNQGTDAVNGEK